VTSGSFDLIGLTSTISSFLFFAADAYDSEGENDILPPTFFVEEEDDAEHYFIEFGKGQQSRASNNL